MSIALETELPRLRVALRDLVALSTIPAAWIGRDPAAIAAGLADVLVGSLQLDFAFVRLCDPGGDVAVDATRGSGWPGFPDWLRFRLADAGAISRKEVVSEVGDPVVPRRGIVIPVGVEGQAGLVAAASERPDFPAELDQLLLSVAANHAATAFQSALTLDERKKAEKTVRQARDELERKVAERTAELLEAAEERVAHLQFLESLDRVNRAMQGTNDLEQMMSDVLDAVLSIFDADRAWLAYPCDPDAPSWRLVMEHSRPGFPGAFAREAAFPTDEEAARVFRLGRASGGPVRCDPGSRHPIPPSFAEQWGVQSQIVMAVYPKGDRPYMFGLHQCSYPRVWTPEEERLFQEIGRRLTDGLTTLLMFRTLRVSEARLAEAQRIAHVAYWECDLDTDHLTWSDEAYRIFGLLPQERQLTLADVQASIHPDDRAVMRRANDTAIGGGPRYDVEYRVVRPDGEVRIVHSQGDVVRDEAGRARRLFGTVQDITERRRASEALQEAQAELARVTRVTMLGEITASIAHEVNQPLSAVVLSGNACRRWLAADPANLDEAREAASHIISDAERAGKIITRIRTLARRGDSERQALDVNDVIREALEFTRFDLERKRIVVVAELVEDLPPVRGDRVQLQQVLVNLLLNAGDAMADMPPELRTLTVASRRDDRGGVLVKVKDFGKGIDPAHRDRVFEAFFSTKSGGLGMGLAISRSIVEAHGGRIWAAPNDGGPGTVMSVLLPAAASSGAA